MWDKNKQRECRRKYYLTVERKLRSDWFASNGPCKKCGSWEDLELDHINPKEKESESLWGWSEQRRKEELAKCQVLCKKCHKFKTLLETAIRLPKIFNHGSRNCYSRHKCRCDKCKEAYKKYRHDKYVRTGK